MTILTSEVFSLFSSVEDTVALITSEFYLDVMQMYLFIDCFSTYTMSYIKAEKNVTFLDIFSAQIITS